MAFENIKDNYNYYHNQDFLRYYYLFNDGRQESSED